MGTKKRAGKKDKNRNEEQKCRGEGRMKIQKMQTQKSSERKVYFMFVCIYIERGGCIENTERR